MNAFAALHGLVVIEDAACAFGSRYKGRPVGVLGDFGSFSLHPRKSLTTGEGGILTVRKKEWSTLAEEIRNHGIGIDADGKADFTNAGLNYRLTDFQSALLEGQLSRLDGILAQRRRIASRYQESLSHPLLMNPYRGVDTSVYETTWQSYHVVLDGRVDRKRLIRDLAQMGVGSNYGAQCIPDTPFYRGKYELNPAVRYPQAYRAYHHGLVLPLFDTMDLQQADKVIQTLTTLLESYGE